MGWGAIGCLTPSLTLPSDASDGRRDKNLDVAVVNAGGEFRQRRKVEVKLMRDDVAICSERGTVTGALQLVAAIQLE